MRSASPRVSARVVVLRLLRTLVVFAAMVGIVPGAEEILEQVAELAQHGHPAHSVPEDLNHSVEHGCTPVQHACPCHESAPTTGTTASVTLTATAEWLTLMIEGPAELRSPDELRRRMNRADLDPSSRATAPPTPPPNAQV